MFREPLVVFGAGGAGLAFARALHERQLLGAWWTRSQERAEEVRSNLGYGPLAGGLPTIDGPTTVLLCVPDDALPRMVAILAPSLPDETVLLHCSGALGGGALAEAARAEDRERLHFGGIHPLQSLSRSDFSGSRFKDAFFAISGDAVASVVATRLAELLQGRPSILPDHARVAYHLAAVVASNGVYGLLEAVRAICAAAGLESTALGDGLYKLASDSMMAAGEFGVDQAATGPVVRGDVDTVTKHLDWSSENGVQTQLYQALGANLVSIAERRGLPTQRLAAIELALSGAGTLTDS